MRIKFSVLLLSASILFSKTNAQDLNAMATGNYAGVNGVSFNPASIADSRYKFDINLIGISSTYSNNYLQVKNTAFVRRLFYKDPYNSSFAAVKNDLLIEDPSKNAKVFGSVRSNIHFPLSFMVTTGKRSAIAITMNNRTVNKVDSMPLALARSFYGELRDPSLYGKDIRMDSLQYNFLNWQEVSFTYSRVIIGSKHHLLKMGVTLKWLGANAGGYFQTDNAVLNFKDSQTMSFRSPLVHYARTERADIGAFKRKDIFNNLEDQAFGWDAGLVYEFRTKVKKFRYIDEDLEQEVRRDMNKYMFRLGLSVVDVGRFTLNKKELTNDYSANILNWDFSKVKASNVSDWDTAFAKKVNYINGAAKTFTYKLPAAVIANFDLHLFGGFYVNIAAKAPLESFNKKADAYITSNRWVAVTPRFESKFLGIYVPVSRVNKQTFLGATVRFGPVYLGSNNLAEVLSNPTSKAADFHAGVRLGFPYGKPNKISKAVKDLMNGNVTNTKFATQQQVDSLHRELDKLRTEVIDSLSKKDLKVIINNDGITSEELKRNGDSIVINNRSQENQRLQQQQQQQQQQVQQASYQRIDTQTDSLVSELARKNLELERLKQDDVSGSNGKKSRSSKRAGKETMKVETSNKDIEKEMERIRRQMQIQNAALIGGGTAAVIATSGNKSDKKEAAGVKADTIRKDSIIMQKADTVYIRDTVKVNAAVADDAAFHVVKDQSFKPILFANGSAVIAASDKARIQQLANETVKHPDWRLEVTGMTDANGSIETNRKMAAQRTNAVSSILLQNGVKDNQIIYRSKLSDTNNIPATENPRRIEIRVLSKK